jgi:hypothetical protein
MADQSRPSTAKHSLIAWVKLEDGMTVDFLQREAQISSQGVFSIIVGERTVMHT